MKLISTRCVVLAGLLLTAPVRADDYADAALALCEKVKSCAVEQMGEREITPEIREMMAPLLEGMCDQVLQQIPELAKEHELYAPALACMKSLQAVDCANMQTIEHETEACQQYKELSSK